MLVYCPQCSNLIDKIYTEKKEGDVVVRKCQRCKNTVRTYIKYKAISKIKVATEN